MNEEQGKDFGSPAEHNLPQQPSVEETNSYQDNECSAGDANQISLEVGRVTSGLVFSLGAAAVMVPITYLGGWFALPLALVAGFVLVGYTITGTFRNLGNAAEVISDVPALCAGPDLPSAPAQIDYLSKPLYALLAIALIPCAGFVVGGIAKALFDYTTPASLCKTYDDFYAASMKPSTSYFDDDWFNKLDDLGNSATKYRGYMQEDVRSAGKELLSLTKKKSGLIVTVNINTALRAAEPISAVCIGD